MLSISAGSNVMDLKIRNNAVLLFSFNIKKCLGFFIYTRSLEDVHKTPLPTKLHFCLSVIKLALLKKMLLIISTLRFLTFAIVLKQIISENKEIRI